MTPPRTVSPPPLKRRRVSPSSGATAPQQQPPLAPSLASRPIAPLQPHHLRVFSWNINGISPFLQKSITSYFGPGSGDGSGSRGKRQEKRTPSPSSSHHAPKDGEQSRDAEVEASPSLRACLRRWKFPHVLCLQEVKIAPGDERTRNAVRQAVKAPTPHGTSREGDKPESEPGYRAFFSLPRDKFNAKGFGGKVYGVCMLVREDLIREQCGEEHEGAVGVAWDLEGRVLKLELEQGKVVMFGVYAVNGTENPYRDPKSGLIAGTRHDWKRAFHGELRDEARSYEHRGWTVVIAGDLNIARAPVDGFPGIRLTPAHVANRKDFDDKFTKQPDAGGLGMLDSFRELHGEERKYSYRSRGIPWGSSCDRVDLILLSRGAKQSLVEADILDEEAERGPSDHVPLYATLDLNRLQSA